MPYAGNDIYCDLIIPGKLPVKVFRETANVLAFKHTKPSWPTHYVVVPKQHVDSLLNLNEVSELLLSELLAVVSDVARHVTKEKGAARVLTNLGNFQDSKHLHFHVYNDKA